MTFIRLCLTCTLLVLSQWLHADITELNSMALKTLMDEGVTLVDVRREDEWHDTGVIEGSHLLTFFDQRGNYDARAWLSELEKITDKGDKVVLICARGVRSSNIAKLLDKRLGYTGIHNVTDGILRWIKEGYPVVKH